MYVHILLQYIYFNNMFKKININMYIFYGYHDILMTFLFLCLLVTVF